MSRRTDTVNRRNRSDRSAESASNAVPHHAENPQTHMLLLKNIRSRILTEGMKSDIKYHFLVTYYTSPPLFSTAAVTVRKSHLFSLQSMPVPDTIQYLFPLFAKHACSRCYTVPFIAAVNSILHNFPNPCNHRGIRHVILYLL